MMRVSFPGTLTAWHAVFSHPAWLSTARAGMWQHRLREATLIYGAGRLGLAKATAIKSQLVGDVREMRAGIKEITTADLPTHLLVPATSLLCGNPSNVTPSEEFSTPSFNLTTMQLLGLCPALQWASTSDLCRLTARGLLKTWHVCSAQKFN